MQIAGAEILPPLGYAMGLIHRQHGNPDSRHRPAKSFRLQPLRGHIDDFIHPRSHIPVDQPDLGRGQGAVDIGPCHSHAFQRHHLILHQGNEGGYHQGNALHHKSGNLIAQALSAPCGHDAEHIPPGQLGPNQVFLPLPEGFVAKVFTEKFLYFFHFLLIFFPKTRHSFYIIPHGQPKKQRLFSRESSGKRAVWIRDKNQAIRFRSPATRPSLRRMVLLAKIISSAPTSLANSVRLPSQ